MSEIRVGEIQPIQFKDLRVGQAEASAQGHALYLPQFSSPPALVEGTETRDDDGNVIGGTGIPVAETIHATDQTIERAGVVARRLLAAMPSLPLTEQAADLMTLAIAVLHHENAKKGA
jgi:hypothetical protein